MTILSDRQLYEEGMTTDQIAGFRAVVAKPRTPRGAEIGLAPDHLRGARLSVFEEGALIGRRWTSFRIAAGHARRRIRAEEIATIGACTPINDLTGDDEPLSHLRLALGKRA